MKENVSKIEKIMADKKGLQVPVSQGGHDPPAPQNPPPTQNPQIPIVPNAPLALEALHLPTPHVPPLNWSHFNTNILKNHMKMQNLTYLGQITGWTHMDFRTTLRYKDFV